MCFSAPASFVAGAALIPAGVYCARAAARKRRSLLPLAFIPLAFSAQQFCEGLVWVGLGHNDAGLVRDASTVFLFFAIPFWPVWVPFSVMAAETRPRLRLAFGLLAALSLAFGWLYLPLALDPERWLVTEVVGHSLHYEFSGLPAFQAVPRGVWRGLYLVAVCAPLAACSTGPRARLVGGLAVTASFVVSYLFFWYAFTSVWCFFAAVLALFLCQVFRQLSDPALSQAA
jgi:hypothetical protein